MMYFLRIFAFFFKKTCWAASLFLLCSALVTSRSASLLEQIKNQGRLEFLSATDPNILTQDAPGVAGLEFELMQRFAQRLGVSLLITQPGDRQTLLYELQHKPLAIGASGIQVSPGMEGKILYGPSYTATATIVIGHSGLPLPENIQDLTGHRLLVKAGSYQADMLRNLQKNLPSLTWEEEDLDMQDLQERVHSGKAEIALIDRDCFEQNRALYTQATVAFHLETPELLAWAFAPSSDGSLREAAVNFFSELETSGALASLQTQYAKAAVQIEPDEQITQFNSFADQRLPRWEPALRAAAAANGLDWAALAAVGFQESKWDASAVSETGVRGLMMLTSAAAKDVDIVNPLDPKQSILGGARYLRMLQDKLPEDILPTDRLALALVAYNIGYQHMEDARQLTLNAGKNPNLWEDVKTELPRLGQKRYYQNLRAGYARGRGAVIYVDNVLTFSSLLNLREQEENRMLLATNTKLNSGSGTDVSPEISAAIQKLSAANAL